MGGRSFSAEIWAKRHGSLNHTWSSAAPEAATPDRSRAIKAASVALPGGLRAFDFVAGWDYFVTTWGKWLEMRLQPGKQVH